PGRLTLVGRFDLAAPGERARQRAAVDELELAADGHAVRDPGRRHAVLLRERRDEMGGRVALDGDARRDDHLVDLAHGEALLEQLEPELAGADAVDRRKVAEQHEVAAAIRVRALDREEIRRRLDDAEVRRIALRAAAKAASRLLGERAAPLAVANRLRGGIERARKAARRLALAVAQMKGHALRRLLADARETLQRLDQLREKRRIDVRHRGEEQLRTAA